MGRSVAPGWSDRRAGEGMIADAGAGAREESGVGARADKARAEVSNGPSRTKKLAERRIAFEIRIVMLKC